MNAIRFLMLALVVASCDDVGERMPDSLRVDAGASDLSRGDDCRTDKIDWNSEDGGTCCGAVGEHCCSGTDPCDPGLACRLGWTSRCDPD